MATEIERKFLILDERWRDQVTQSQTMRQGYLIGGKAASVRIRLEGQDARLNIKSATLGIQRQEYEYLIPLADAEQMLDSLCGGKTVTKTRHYVPDGDHCWEIDEFHDQNAGLIVAEIELNSVDEHFERPAWLGAEVSGDTRYYNSELLNHPFTEW